MDVKGDEKVAAAESPISAEKVDAPQSEGAVPRRALNRSHDADDAMKAFTEYDSDSIVVDEATNKRLQRRIDWNILPLMCVVYGLNFLDKTTLSYASVMGLQDDIGLVGDQYQWLGSMFYFGYLAWEYPTSRLLQRLPLGKYSAFNVTMWGITLTCFAAVQNFSGAVAVRFFLGLFESAVSPGFALLTSQWYTTKEQSARTAIWFSFNGWAQIVGGFMAYGIARGVQFHGALLAGWRIVFLATGLFTAAMGILFFFVVPDNQLNARWLKPHDRVLAVERIRVNQQGVGNKHWKAYQFKEAITDPVVLLMVAYSLIADIPNGGITNFFSQLIVSFGYTEQQSLLYGTPGGAVEVITIVAWGIATMYFPNLRIPLASISLAIALLGIILIVALPLDNNIGRLVGYYFTQASATPFVALLSFVGTNVAGYTKKTTVAAMYLIAYCVGNIIGPQTFRPSAAPRYVSAEIVIIVCWGVCMIILYAIFFLCRRRNRQKAAMRAQPGYEKLKDQEFLDLTDKENPEFVYAT